MTLESISTLITDFFLIDRVIFLYIHVSNRIHNVRLIESYRLKIWLLKLILETLGLAEST